MRCLTKFGPHSGMVGALMLALMLAACGGDAGGKDGTSSADTASATDTTADTSTADTSTADTSGPADTAAADSGGSDTAAPDTAQADVAAADTAKSDSSEPILCGPGCLEAFPEKDPWRPHWDNPNAPSCSMYEHVTNTEKPVCYLNNAEEYHAEFDCWNHGQVNELGVGKPCKPGEVECGDQVANCCRVDDKGYGAFCTIACKTNAECGKNAWCHTGFGVCMPWACGGDGKSAFKSSAKPSKYKGKGFPCYSDKADAPPIDTATGLGTPCKATADCAGNAKAQKCLGQESNLDGVASSFCYMECKTSADCGAEGSCYFDAGPPYVCVPKVCNWFVPNKTFDHGPTGMPAGPVCNKP